MEGWVKRQIVVRQQREIVVFKMKDKERRTKNQPSPRLWRAGKQHKRGFTLIELLVVIVIIGVLMGILLVSYQGTRVTARNGKRKADLEQIRSGLELYHADCGEYPTGSLLFGTGKLESNCLGPTVTYMTLVPQDPLFGAGYTYRYAAIGDPPQTYVLCAYLEGGGEDLCSGIGSFGSCGPEDCNYKTCQP